MPIALDPHDTVEIVLDSDMRKPEGERPIFLGRFLSIRQRKELARLIDSAYQLSQAEKEAESEAALAKAIGMSLAGWERMRDCDGREIPFSLDRLEDVLTDAERWELCTKLIKAPGLAEIDRKKSGWPSSSGSEGSADPAATASV